jgi:hypothetical protein
MSRKGILKFLASIVQKLYKMEIDKASKKHLMEARACLEIHSLIVYSNHTSPDDAVILLALLVDAFHPPVNALFMRLGPIRSSSLPGSPTLRYQLLYKKDTGF